GRSMRWLPDPMLLIYPSDSPAPGVQPRDGRCLSPTGAGQGRAPPAGRSHGGGDGRLPQHEFPQRVVHAGPRGPARPPRRRPHPRNHRPRPRLDDLPRLLISARPARYNVLAYITSGLGEPRNGEDQLMTSVAPGWGEAGVVPRRRNIRPARAACRLT